jgi:hypothetical protein
MIKGIVDFLLLRIVPVVAVLLLVAGGILYLTSAGDPGRLTQATSIIKSTMIGLAIILSSWLITNTFFTFIGLEEWTGLKEGWFEIQCGINLS